ncbi:MAG: glutathione S-transferase N-terminal domain-containing protein [Alphaproteobacteria bacterium]|nr:glutathione S-transferase N-terminal domain-containing protein [Alphaproteobacteria bacterium]
MLELHYWPTPNGKKVTILLEELGVPYEIKPVNIGRGDQFAPDFLKMSPNNRMPALVDTEPKTGTDKLCIFESAAIMMYVAEKEGKFFPQEMRKKYDVIQWVMWQMANQGPKFGEQGHFFRASQNPKNGEQTYAIRRFSDEVHRLYGVMNLGLHKKDWLAAGEYTIADMICYPWAAGYKLRQIDLDEFPNVKRWMEKMESRPAVKKAMSAGAEYQEDTSKLSDSEKERRAKLLVNQRATPVPAAWG